MIKFSRNTVPPLVFGVSPPEIAVPPPKVVVPSPGDVFMVHAVFFLQLVDSQENQRCSYQMSDFKA